jgi:hypothetical protein
MARSVCIWKSSAPRRSGRPLGGNMNAFTGPLLGFLLTGNYLLFWPVYRAFHAKRTQRRRALFRLFLLELSIYVLVTASVVIATYSIPDFHHGGFLLAEIVHIALVVIFWVATYGVWADNSPYEVES